MATTGGADATTAGTGNTDDHGEGRDDDRPSAPYGDKEEAEEGKTCGICPRVIKGQLLGTPDGWSVDIYFNPCTMLLSVMIIWSFVIWAALDPDSKEGIDWLQERIVYYGTWFYVGSMLFIGGFITFLLFGKYGDIKLGPEDEPPRFSIGSWFAMLFSAGVGTGLYFFGVAEPIWHYYDAKNGNNRYYTDGDNLERALDAMNISWFHWGLTASSVYCAVGLPLAYFAHKKNAPFKFSAAFLPLIGKKYAEGFVGDMIDTFAVVGTMFGVATSLGLGVIQLNAMLNFMDPDNIDNEDTDLRIIIIWVITAFATISVFTGLDVGIRRLSEGNFVFCLLLLIYLFFVCDPFYLTNLFIQTAGYHVQHVFEITFFTDAFQQAGFTGGNDSYESFMSWWTVFYWGWWIAWSPFVGIFIAQISRGRTIRQFILGNMFVPTLFTSMWLCVFGGVGLYHELAFDVEASGSLTGNWLYDAVSEGTACDSDATKFGTYKGANVVYLECFATETMLFQMIDAYPLGGLMNVLAGIGIVTYFVTSSDSASHVIDMLTANGNEEPPKIQRIFWALSEGAVASVLLGVGGKEALQALQTVSIAAGLPFCAILLVLCYAFWYTLKVETTDPKDVVPYNRWQMDFLDSTNPQLTTSKTFDHWMKAAICPCFMQYQNYLLMAEKDEDSVVFSHGSKIAAAFWAFLIFGTTLGAIVFLSMGIGLEGWGMIGLTFYVFYIGVNAWQRSRIRKYFGIQSEAQGLCCDILAHFCCTYCWSITQERVQCYSNMEAPSASPNAVDDNYHSGNNNPDSLAVGSSAKDVELVASASDLNQASSSNVEQGIQEAFRE